MAVFLTRVSSQRQECSDVFGLVKKYLNFIGSLCIPNTYNKKYVG